MFYIVHLMLNKYITVKVTPLESLMGNPHGDKDKDKDATGTPNTYVFDPNDI